MKVFDIEGTSHVVISELDGFIIDGANGFFIEELEKDFKNYIYAMSREDYEEKVKQVGKRPNSEIMIGRNTKGFYLHKPLFNDSEEYYSVKIDHDNDSVEIAYEGSAPKRFRNQVLFGPDGAGISRDRFF